MAKIYSYKYKCLVCKKNYNTNRNNQKVCSDECRTEYTKVGRGRPDLPPGTVGAIAELEVAAKLLLEGWSVFRALSHHCFCDLIAIKGVDFMYVEVRSGYKSGFNNKNIIFSKKISSNNGLPTHYAIYIPETREIVIQKIKDEEFKMYTKKCLSTL